ncbi:MULTISPECIES: RES family NAD+ phosphorylase [unclassified Herbaspirillum]|uniref:RES family NAD+ phosphorylase n=1 Tax=unclassified Herbaspirillum TaxID=2624150 RepID=UPI000E2F7A5F|nr:MULTISPECIES: RES family NAD+ phosphorylase [unclassified Herbaspirillum]RFB68588.1 RES domain-containing protein [Herbaspirillum sp. 3R-3a1]TFI05495.1 RES domain-containing protein [Herbaspirillum sp. 3R11]TFI13595.1 RES domain-containing protein [Herbaspirillum sp. 3R-11]TFI27099.1 RES domain-containing protein [Herbaspirillum sp. 3C11]
MTYICRDCIDDGELKLIVEREGILAECRCCGEDVAPAITVEALAEIVDPVFRHIYGVGEEIPHFSSGDSDEVYFAQAGDELSLALQELLGQQLDCEDELISALIEKDDYWQPDGGEPFYDESNNYDRIRHPPSISARQWHNTLEELKHSRRFFSPAAQSMFGSLFRDVHQITFATRKRNLSVVKTLPVGTKLYRARACRHPNDFNVFAEDPFKHVGPPPPEAARHGRMNPEGVTVLYCASDEKTCLAEMRPAIGMQLVLIALETTEKLRLLDFTRLTRSMAKDTLSYFSPDYFSERDRRALLGILHSLISQPITPDREADYLITQTMAEYLAHVYEPAFDGISFSSSQSTTGTNVVIFPRRDLLAGQPADFFRVQYVPASLASYRTKKIFYQHDKDHVYFGDDDNGPMILGPYEPDDEFY